ncbi:MAG: hypothetical protein JO016_09985 [Actinobacteria bacterium]|nr:hypothetical protein [Actinomycetota bacterium]
MTTLHAELCGQPGSRANFARQARDWLTGARARLFPELDRALTTAGPSADAPDDEETPWGPPGGVWARLLIRQQPQAVGGLSLPFSQRAWRRTLDGIDRDHPFQIRLEMTPLGPGGQPAGAEPAVLSVQRSQHDPRWARFAAQAPPGLAPWPRAWADFLREQAVATGADYGHVTDDATSSGTALERAVLGVSADPPGIPRSREVLRGYSWVTIVAAPLAARLGGAAALAASGAFAEVSPLPGGSGTGGSGAGGPVLLRATAELDDYRGPAVRRVFGVLAPVLLRGRPDPEAVSGSPVRLVLDADASCALS